MSRKKAVREDRSVTSRGTDRTLTFTHAETRERERCVVKGRDKGKQSSPIQLERPTEEEDA